MNKKEHYRNNLPHYQKPGQAYLVSWCLKEAVPKHAFDAYRLKMELLKNQIEFFRVKNPNQKMLDEVKRDYSIIRKKYLKAFDDILNVQELRINLGNESLTQIIIEALEFWNGSRIKNYAYCVMPNHIHWVLRTYEEDDSGMPVYLQDIMHSVKRYSAKEINKTLNRRGAVWHKENFETTIRDDRHFMNAINYTLDNPVVAGFVQNREDWKGSNLVSLDF